MTPPAPPPQNPVLRGFNPDPSICRANGEYFIATSTFEWFPGVQIFRSRDLANWTLACRPLARPAQLDMRGNPDSCGVWAPCLSRADGMFWLVYTDVKRYDGDYKDSHNYLVVAPDIAGPWSDPVYLNSSGFDPSLFHDDDGRKYLVNPRWDHRRKPRPGRPPADGHFGGILLQEYDPAKRALTGPVEMIFDGSPLGLTEGPHLHKRNGYYYLIVAEGGTGYEHAVTHARSRNLRGPYELHPDRHVITSKDHPDAPLQRAGHGQFVEADNGDVWHAHLCSRPLPGTRRSPCGRETALQLCRWGDDGWLRMVSNGRPVPEAQCGDATAKILPRRERTEYRFDQPELHPDFQWPRAPHPERIFSLSERRGCLRLFGRESIGSWFEQSLVARRQTEWRVRAATLAECRPEDMQQMAGLAAYYNRAQFHYLFIGRRDDGRRFVGIQSCSGGWPESNLDRPLTEVAAISDDAPVALSLEIDHDKLQFFYADGDAPATPAGGPLDASVLSDEGGRGEHASFTGNFIGMAAQDLGGRAFPADFRSFSYETW